LSTPNYAARILLVDDERQFGELIVRVLPEYDLDFVQSYNEALDHLKSGLPYDVAIVDLNLVSRKSKDQLGKKVLAHLLANCPSTRRIALTGASPGSVRDILEKYQLDDLLFKQHLDLDDVGLVVEAALAQAPGAVAPALGAERSKLWEQLHALKRDQGQRFEARAVSLENDIRDAAAGQGRGQAWAGGRLAELEAEKEELAARRSSFDSACEAVAKAIAATRGDKDLTKASQELGDLTSQFGDGTGVRDP
jgi:CheY-like chemotaxis protein